MLVYVKFCLSFAICFGIGPLGRIVLGLKLEFQVDIPDFDVAILAAGGDGLAVLDPGDPRDLTLGMGRSLNLVFFRSLHTPDNQGAIQSTGSDEQ